MNIPKLLTFYIPNRKLRHKYRKKIWLFMKRDVIKQAKQNIENRLRTEKTLAILTIPYETDLYQRPQHLFNNFSIENTHCIYITYNYSELYSKINDNLNLLDWSVFWVLDISLFENIYFILPSTSYLPFDQVIKLKQMGVHFVYDYIDEMSPAIIKDMDVAYENYTRLEEIEPEIIIASAKNLYDEMQSRFPNKKIVLAQNAVEVSHFENIDSEIPKDLAKILSDNKPIVGYYGAMAGWLDWNLINKMSLERPEYNFVYIGVDYQDNLKHLMHRPNVHFLGAKPYKELPKYANHFNCCIIPFGDDDVAKSTSPLKLFEYMAMKKPVVVTENLIECHGYNGVLVATKHSDFIKKLDEAIKLEQNVEIRQSLYEYALKNTWNQRAKDILKAVYSD